MRKSVPFWVYGGEETRVCSSSCLSFEFECYLQLMPVHHVAVKTADLHPGTDNDWVVSRNKRSRASIIVCFINIRGTLYICRLRSTEVCYREGVLGR